MVNRLKIYWKCFQKIEFYMYKSVWGSHKSNKNIIPIYWGNPIYVLKKDPVYLKNIYCTFITLDILQYIELFSKYWISLNILDFYVFQPLVQQEKHVKY